MSLFTLFKKNFENKKKKKKKVKKKTLKMFKAIYTGKQSSLTLYKFSPQHKKPAILKTFLPSLKTGQSIDSQEVETDYVFEKSHSTPKKSSSNDLMFGESFGTPIADFAVTNMSLLRLDTFRDLNPILINDLPELPLIDSPSFPAIFDDKIDACSKICSFADEKCEQVSIDRKTTHLTEIHRLFLGSSPQSSRLTDEQFEAIYNMCMKNIVRRFPNLGPMAFINVDVAPLTEPAWPHLSIVYNILMKVLYEFPDASFFTIKTGTRLLRAGASGDSRERQQISTFLSKFMLFRYEFLEPMIEKFSSKIQAYIEGLSTPFIISTIINAFIDLVNESNDIEPSYTKFFRNRIVPLLADRYFSFFDQSLVKLIDFFIEDDQRNAYYVVTLILKKWPQTSLNKQTTFLSILMRSIPKMTPREIQPMIPKIFSLLAQSSDSECMKVAETAFSMWTTIGFERIINDNIKLILKVFTPHIMNARHNHWSPSVRSNANFAISVLMKRDSKFMHAVTSQGQNSETDYDNEQLRTWVVIARSASQTDESLNLSKKLNEISAEYSPFQSVKLKHQLSSSKSFQAQQRQRSYSLKPNNIFKPMVTSNPNFL